MGSISPLNSVPFVANSSQNPCKKFKKFKEFLRNSLNFPQNSQTLFTNSRKMLKHFHKNSQSSQTTLAKLEQISRKSLLTQKSLPKKLALLAHSKSSTKKARSLKKVRLKKLAQKPTARAALHTAGWCLPAPSRKSHFGLKCCILRNSRFPQQNPHLL